VHGGGELEHLELGRRELDRAFERLPRSGIALVAVQHLRELEIRRRLQLVRERLDRHVIGQVVIARDPCLGLRHCLADLRRPAEHAATMPWGSSPSAHRGGHGAEIRVSRPTPPTRSACARRAASCATRQRRCAMRATRSRHTRCNSAARA
jgi:hypothetical protein